MTPAKQQMSFADWAEMMINKEVDKSAKFQGYTCKSCAMSDYIE